MTTTLAQSPAPPSRSLYALTLESHQIDRQLAAALDLACSDDPEQQAEAESLITSLLEAASDHQALLHEKLSAICRVHEGLLGKATFLRAIAADRLAKAEAQERAADRLLSYLSRCLAALHPGQQVFSLPEHTIRWRSSTAIAIEDDAALPASFQRHEIRIRLAPEAAGSLDALLGAIGSASSSIPPGCCSIHASAAPDRSSIKAALQAGQLVPGSRLERRRHWSIQ